MTYGTVNADTLVTSTSGGILGAGNASIMKNRIINGAMVISQRGTSFTQDTTVQYTLDRWNVYGTVASKCTVAQSSTAPAGFNNSLLVTSSSAYSVGASDRFMLQYLIEGFNTADLNWGTANAKTVTFSFWVQSSLTGTFGGSFKNETSDRSYPFAYTISAANTWEQKSITIAGDTTGTWVGATNGCGIRISIGLGAGSTYSGTAGSWSANNYQTCTGATSVVGTSGATFYITGVQLEVGSSATGFEYRIYGTELNNCYRYYAKLLDTSSPQGTTMGTGFQLGTTTGVAAFTYPIAMRSAPTVGQSNMMVSDNNSYNGVISSIDSSFVNLTSGYINVTYSSGGATYRPFLLRGNTSGSVGYLTLSSEL